MAINITHAKESLEAERLLLIEELKKLGRINPDNAADWEPVAAQLNIDSAEEEERAEEITSFEERSALEFEIEEKWNEVSRALAAIENGTYGHCKMCKAEIEEARLMANPSAETCTAHMG